MIGWLLAEVTKRLLGERREFSQGLSVGRALVLSVSLDCNDSPGLSPSSQKGNLNRLLEGYY